VTKLYASIFILFKQPHSVQCQTLCGSEVTEKLNSWKSRGARAPVHATLMNWWSII